MVDNGGTVDFRVDLITPAFSYGAVQEEGRITGRRKGKSGPPLRPEIRETSLKGLLRWWFRAAANGTLLHRGFSPLASLRCLRGMEESIFGSTGKSSSFRIRVRGRKLRVAEAGALFSEPREKPRYKIGYLGYGIPDEWKCLRGSFTLSVDFRRGTSLLEKSLVLLTIATWGALGGMGRRHRRGLGSVAVSSVGGKLPEGIEPEILISEPFDHESFMRVLHDLSDRISDYSRWLKCVRDESSREGDFPPTFASLHPNSLRMLMGPTFSKADEALAELAFRLRQYREDPQTGKTFQYLEVIYPILTKGKSDGDTKLEWSVFGLPHNYFSRSLYAQYRMEKDIEGRSNVSYKLSVVWRDGRGNRRNRRASPLFAKVVSLEDGYAPLVHLMPSPYLPPGSRLFLDIMGKRYTMEAPVPSMEKLEGFMDYLGRVGWSKPGDVS